MWNYLFSVLLCIIAAWTDVKTKKIPNWLILSGLAGGLLLNFWVNPLPVKEHILRGVFVLVILLVGMFRLLGLGDIKFWCVLTVVIGPVRSSIIVAAASVLLVIYAMIKDKDAVSTIAVTVVDVAQEKKVRPEVLGMRNRGYPLAVFMLLPTVVCAVIGIRGELNC